METMTFSARAHEQYKRTVAKHKPETGGVLIGDPANPFYIEDFRMSPPTRKEDGSYDHSQTHFAIDADYVNWAIDNEWGPNGQYVIGFIHSHPRGISRLSGGDMNGLAGDVPLLSAILETPQMQAAGLDQLLAPIATFKADGSDELHGWMLRRGSKKPEKVDIVIEGEAEEIALPPDDDELDELVSKLANEDADLIDCLLQRRRATLDTPGFHFSDRALVKRLYGQLINRAFQDQTRQHSKSALTQALQK